MNRKSIVVAVACLVGAGSMFFLGVMTERHWAARRLAVADESDIARRVATAVARGDAEIVDVNALDFPEALRCLDPRPQDLELADTANADATPGAQSSVRPAGEAAPAAPAPALFLQVGAFGEKANAEHFVAALTARGFDPKMQTEAGAVTPTYRIRIGPFASLGATAATTRRLEAEDLAYLIVR